jgi:hypothetical protein
LAEHPEEEELEISNDKDDRKEERTSLPIFVKRWHFLSILFLLSTLSLLSLDISSLSNLAKGSTQPLPLQNS